MKLYIAILFFLTAGFCAYGQQTELRVIIAETKADTLTGATLQLFSLPDSQLITTQAVDKAGNRFNVRSFSKYLLNMTAVGYGSLERVVSVTSKSITIQLYPQKNIRALSGVVVVSKKPLVRQEDDKTIVDAEVLANSSANAYEVLEKTPGAIVDQDGNVYLSSMSAATIQINGRDVKLSAADLASLLKSLPANSVSKIEILRSPSAKYDAASSGGIVNIVLKKGVKLGTNGSVNAAYFQGRYSTETAGFNLNKGKGTSSSYLSYQFTSRNNFEELNSERLLIASHSILGQKAYTTYPSNNHYIGAGTDIAVSKKFNIAYDLRISANDNRSNTTNLIDITDRANQLVTGSNASVISNQGSSLYVGNNLSSKLKIDTAGSEWTVQVDYNHFKTDNDQVYNNNYFAPVKPTLFGNGNSINNKNILTAQTDLVLKLKHKISIETGLKMISSHSRNAADYFYQTGNSGIRQDSFQTNTFKYKENIGSAYVQVSKKFFGLIIKPGIRMERTDIAGRQINPRDTSLSINRTDFFPYLYLRHKLLNLFGFELNGNAIYRRSITRPYYEALNPYPKYIDQYLFDVGNPNLRPQFTTNYEFNITANEFTIFSIGVNNTKDIFTNVTYQDDVTGIAYRTFDNLGTNRETYLRFVGGIPPRGKYYFYAGAQQNTNNYKGFYQNQPLSYKRSSWVFFMYHNLKITPSLNISVGGFMRLKGLQNFYELNSFGTLNSSINKSIMAKKGNIILSFNDILGTNKTSFSLRQGNVSAIGTRVNDSRRIGLTFRYNFGIKPREEKKALFEQPTEGNN